MWATFAKFVIRFRLAFLIVLFSLTAFMGYHGRNVELSYDFVKLVPTDDPEMVYFQSFLKTFGEDGNIMVVGIRDSSIYKQATFAKLYQLSEEIGKMEGINEVISLPNLKYIYKNEEKKIFEYKPLFPQVPADQATLDSLLSVARNIKLYDGLIFNTENGAIMMAIAIDKVYFSSYKRQIVVGNIIDIAEKFSKETKVEVHFSGVPYVRSEMAKNVQKELRIFLILSLSVTLVALFLFFRSWQPVVFPILMIGMVIIWVIGTIGLLGYKMTMLTGLLPPILVVIGIPNSVYILTKFHQECIRKGDKIEALISVVGKLGIVTLITNTTTAIGFATLITAQISVLQEFGLVAALNIFATFIISLVYLPAIFSYLPMPSSKHTAHLESSLMKNMLQKITTLVVSHRKKIYITSVILAIIGAVGMWRIKAVSYMVDDLPQSSRIIQDLKFLEKNFKGVMPLEIVIDAGKPKAMRRPDVLTKIDSFQRFLQTIPHFTPPLSAVTLLKAANQAYFNGSPSDFQLPSRRELAFVQRYIPKSGEITNMTNTFMDTSGQQIRISLKVADLGSVRIDSLVDKHIAPQAKAIFADSGLKSHITGTTLMFAKGNDYLIGNLKQSLALAIVLIGFVIAVLFRNIRIMLISITTNILPLLITAGLMGYFGIPLKPSTALVFSITFGIAVDDSIHYLARYRQELWQHNFDVVKAVKLAIQETGTSMIYTSLVLFAGFIIFTASDFGGTIALGALTSTTLLLAMFTSLLLLPSLLITFDNGKHRKTKGDWSEDV